MGATVRELGSLRVKVPKARHGLADGGGAAGRPPIVWLPAGHYTSLTYFPLMQKAVIEFLRDGTRPAETQPRPQPRPAP